MDILLFIYILILMVGAAIAIGLMAAAIADGEDEQARFFARCAAACVLWPLAIPALIYYYGWHRKP